MDIQNVNNNGRVVKTEDYDNWVAPTKEEILAKPTAELIAFIDTIDDDFNLLQDVYDNSPQKKMREAAHRIIEKILPTYDFIDALLYNRHQQDQLRQVLIDLDDFEAQNNERLDAYNGNNPEQFCFHNTIAELIKARRFSIEQEIKELDV
ncbi:hypothetical protein [Acinetobacter sp.]|uniref:hypothetical protein n=1 Tax=Acinetobacter sp. TaxID=472 RepID=UPI00388FE487